MLRVNPLGGAVVADTMNNLIPFTYGNNPVRVIERPDGPWFVLADVCEVLELLNTSVVASRLDGDEKAVLSIAYTSSSGVSQERRTLTINESGLWSLVMTSRKPEAKRFKKWLTSEVIPTIRKTGEYKTTDAAAAPAAPTVFPAELLELMREQAFR